MIDPTKNKNRDQQADSEIDIRDILDRYIEQPRGPRMDHDPQTAKAERQAVLIVFFGAGLFGLISTWYTIIKFGWWIENLVIVSTAILVLDLFLIAFPRLITAEYSKKNLGLILFLTFLSIMIAYAVTYLLKLIL